MGQLQAQRLQRVFGHLPVLFPPGTAPVRIRIWKPWVSKEEPERTRVVRAEQAAALVLAGEGLHTEHPHQLPIRVAARAAHMGNMRAVACAAPDRAERIQQVHQAGALGVLRALAAASDVGHGDTRPLGSASVGSSCLQRRAPALCDLAAYIQAIANAHVAVQRAATPDEVEEHQIQASAASQVGDGDIGSLVVIAKRIRHLHRRAPAAGHLAVLVQVPPDAVIAPVSTRHPVQPKDNQVGPTIAVDIRYRDPSSTRFVSEWARQQDGIRPARGNSLTVQIPADAVVAAVGTERVIDVKHDEVRQTVATDIRDGDACPLTLRSEPSGYLDRVRPAPADTTSCIQVPADAVVTTVFTRRVIYMGDNQI